MKKILMLFLITLAFGIYAQDRGADVFVEVSSETLTAGELWTLTLLVDHPVPEDVSVTIPDIDFLYLDRYVKSPRVIETQVQTMFEYRFIPNKSGQFLLDSFSVVTPDGITETTPFVLDIQPESGQQSRLSPRLVWDSVSRQAAAGERLVLSLRITGWGSHTPPSPHLLPPQEFFMPEVPQGVILALVPLSDQEMNSGILIKLALIPARTGNVRLGARTLQYGDIHFEIPSLQINVTENTSLPSVPQVDLQTEPQFAPSASLSEDFPDYDYEFDLTAMNSRFTRGQKYILGFSVFVLLIVIIIVFVCINVLKEAKK